MSSDMFQGKWHELESNIQLYFDKLSAEDVATIAGDGDKLISILHTRYGYNDEQAQDAWDRFMRRYGRA
jgi:uncharacterized protein YjbJ (UPF0337 family)